MAASYEEKRQHFALGRITKTNVAKRQNNRCAHCGENMVSLIKEGTGVEAHHLVPCQSGDIKNDQDKAYITSETNCVWLCKDCHREFGHGGNYATGGIPEPCDYPRLFPYAFGTKGSPRLVSWAQSAEGDFSRIMKNLEKASKAQKKKGK